MLLYLDTDQGDKKYRFKIYINGAFVDHNTGTALDVSETSFYNHKDYIQHWQYMHNGQNMEQIHLMHIVF